MPRVTARRREPWRGIPSRPTSLIGREPDIRAIRELLLRARARLITLTGPPGVGKTRLALEIAARTGPEFGGGTVFVDLSSIADPALVPYAISHAAGIAGDVEESARRSESIVDRLRDYLREQHLLLLLDNLEHVLEAAAQVADLLANSMRLQVLVTSRAPLHLRWEREYPVSPLPTPDPARLLEPEALMQYPAVALFVERARAVLSDFALDDRNARIMAEICAHLEGLPLAIELAAARVKTIPPTVLLQELQRRLEILTTSARDVPARHRSLRAAIAWSYELLGPDAQAFFRRISVFAGDFATDAALAVSMMDGTPSEALERLALLVDSSLLMPTRPVGGEARFRMLEALREFGREQLAACGELQDAREVHARFFVSLARQAEPMLRSPEQAMWLDRLEREFANLRAALAWFLDSGDPVAGLAFAASLERFWLVRGPHAEGRRWLEKALAASSAASAPLRAKALLALASLTALEDDHAAEQLRREAVSQYRAVADDIGTAKALLQLATSVWGRGDGTETLRLLNESHSTFTRLADTQGIADCQRLLVMILAAGGDHARAEDLAANTLAMYRQAGDQWGAATLLNDLGTYARTRRAYDRARASFEEALALRRKLGDRTGTIRTLMNLADTAHDQGNFREAAAHFEEALNLAQEIGNPDAIASTLVGLATQILLQGEHERAERMFADALALCRETGYKRRIALALHGMGLAALQRGDIEAADARLTESLGVYRQSEHAPPVATLDLARVLRDLGMVAETRGDYLQAARRYIESLESVAPVGPGIDIAHGVQRLAELAAKLDRYEEAAILFGCAESLWRAFDLRSPDQEPSMKAIRAALGETKFRRAVARSQALPADRAIHEAIRAARGLQDAMRPAATDSHDLLAPRELEVAALVAQGLSNREIGQRLFISERTAANHVQHILTKLGFTSRAQIAVWAAGHGLGNTAQTERG